MTDTIKISRELLELALSNVLQGPPLDRIVKAKQELRKALATPPADAADMGGQAGEEVEVVAHLMRPDFMEPYVSIRRDCSGVFVEQLMTVAQHQRITAAMAAEVERLREERDSFQRVGILATEERDALRAELAIARRVIDRIGQLCTTPHESKERFIRRVQSVIEWERAAQQEQPQ